NDPRNDNVAIGVPITARNSRLLRPSLFPMRENNETIKVRKTVAITAIKAHMRRVNNAPM
ncbi:MAG: hypothetical protein K6C37_02630, partial [Bacteroidales bacterium]|nr:hypothetical protein [Bacteroidales bacterium]